MLALALAVLAEESLNLLVGYTDWFLVGRFLPGEAPKGALRLVVDVLWMLTSVLSVVSSGALAIVARLVGAGERQEAAGVARQALVIGFVAAAIGMLATSTCPSTFVAAMQLRGDAADLAARYIRILTIGIPFVMIEQVGKECLRGAGDTVSGIVERID